MLNVYIDFKCPASYLALRPTLALTGRLGVRASWRAYSSAERETPAEGADPAVIASHQRVREASVREIHARCAERQGLDMRFDGPRRSADLALGALEGIDGDRTGFVTAAFEAFWRDQADLDDEAAVSALIRQTGTAPQGAVAAARARLEAAQSEAENIGVFATPIYVLGDQLFWGREHLPWIEEILTAELSSAT